jgi:ABC-type maltose transport system permease subunit
MHLLATPRFVLRLLRAGLHAAVLVTVSLPLFLLFLLWQEYFVRSTKLLRRAQRIGGT